MTLTETQIAAVRALEDADGRLTPDQVVEAAKRKDSPLHALFEWDRARAAQAHWIQTARIVIGAVRIVVTTTTSTYKAPHYVRDAMVNGQGYRSTVALRDDPAAALQSMVLVLEIASGHLRRAMDLAEPLGLRNEIDDLIERIVGLVRRTQEKAA